MKKCAAFLIILLFNNFSYTTDCQAMTKAFGLTSVSVVLLSAIAIFCSATVSKNIITPITTQILPDEDVLTMEVTKKIPPLIKSQRNLKLVSSISCLVMGVLCIFSTIVINKLC